MTPQLHTSLEIATSARALAAVGVSLLGCTYCCVHHVLDLEPGFAEAQGIRSHDYACVRGDRPMDAAPLRRRSNVLTSASECGSAHACFICLKTGM